jgi:predicted amidophosphoribosyltransferase
MRNGSRPSLLPQTSKAPLLLAFCVYQNIRKEESKWEKYTSIFVKKENYKKMVILYKERKKMHMVSWLLALW